MNPSDVEILATACFALAVVHTFLVSKFDHLASKFPDGSIGENLFHFLGEVEVVFGLWSAIFITGYSMIEGFALYDGAHNLVGGALHYLESRNFTEPVFVFVIMAMAGTRPVIMLAEKVILAIAKIIPLPEKMAFYVTTLIIGPLLGSFITEPAAMTVTAMIMLHYYYSNKMSNKFKYMTLGLLFVNISIGGTLTQFAAPPVLMVAAKWHFDIPFMLTHFGYKAALACIVSTAIVAFAFRSELKGKLAAGGKGSSGMAPTWWITLIHLLFIGMVVYTAHHTVFFLGLFLFFLGFTVVTSEYQDTVKLKESLLVGFFLAGLVTLGGKQQWWLQPALESMGDLTLFFGAAGLTAITDNAALTYLGSLVEGLSDSAKYNLVAGAVAGGGLTVIANAPNPAGFGILKKSFGSDGISPLGLLAGSLIPTAIALAAFQLLPHL